MFSLLKYFIVENVIHIYSEIIKHSHSYILFHPPALASPATPHSELHVVFDNAQVQLVLPICAWVWAHPLEEGILPVATS